MPLTLPPGKRMAVALTFDFDAHSNWMGSLGRTSLSYLSRGDFGAEEGVPRILQTLGERQLPATWAVRAVPAPAGRGELRVGQCLRRARDVRGDPGLLVPR